MRKIILGILCLSTILATQNALANSELPTKEELLTMLDKKYQIKRMDLKCDTLADLAKAIMDGYQKGVSFDSQYKSANEDSLPEDIKMKERQMVIQAYSYPIYTDKSDKFRVTEKFYLKSFLECRDKGVIRDWDLR
ncbi:hypothetical protein [Acinetobacter brisouii]|uniref:hypothetical protein n=1 Tax=Acinetobacter brisouii TaxID=396323 RepID=UPI00124FF44D|nr:hypothetical protein [Acinetobacter brisouii]